MSSRDFATQEFEFGSGDASASGMQLAAADISRCISLPDVQQYIGRYEPNPAFSTSYNDASGLEACAAPNSIETGGSDADRADQSSFNERIGSS